MYAAWRTADRGLIPVGLMSEAHLLNTIAMIREGRRINEWPRNGFTRHEWLLIFNAELVRRNRNTA